MLPVEEPPAKGSFDAEKSSDTPAWTGKLLLYRPVDDGAVVL